jgi:vacuolar-type H+-ATPase subunit E/Vma4
MSFAIKSSVRFDARKIVEEASKRAFATALTNAKEKVRFLRCPVHGKGATVTIKEDGTTQASLTITGCCDDFRKRARAAISRN